MGTLTIHSLTHSGVLWEWARVTRCFVPIIFVIQVRGKLFVSTNMPGACHKLTKHLFTKIGRGELIDMIK